MLHLPVVSQRLAEHEEQFGTVIAPQCRFNLGLALADSIVYQRSQFAGIAFPCQYRIQDSQSTLAADITEYMMQMQVHLVECLLHVLNPHRCAFD